MDLAEHTSFTNWGYYKSNWITTSESNVGVRGENWTSRKKPLRTEKRTSKLSPHMTAGREVEPWPYCWKANALTITPTLLSQLVFEHVVNFAGERRTAELESCTTGEEFAGLILEDRSVKKELAVFCPSGFRIRSTFFKLRVIILDCCSWNFHFFKC